MKLSWIKMMGGLCTISAVCVTICVCLFLNNGDHFHQRAWLGGMTSTEDFITHPKRILCSIDKNIISENQEKILDSIDKDIISKNQESFLRIKEAMSEKNMDRMLSKVDNSII
jgi:hypothetical protein